MLLRLDEGEVTVLELGHPQDQRLYTPSLANIKNTWTFKGCPMEVP